MKRKLKQIGKHLLSIFFFLGVLVLVMYLQGTKPQEIFKPFINIGEDILNINEKELSGAYKVIKVVDGDTLLIDYEGTKEYVRLIGIDTPESVNPDESKNTPEGIIASDYTKSIISDYIYLEFDVINRDDYGRLLAYVYLEDGTMLNMKIISEGYAYTMNIAPNVKYQNDFIKAFEKARQNKLGLWKENE